MKQDNSFVCDFLIFLTQKRNSSASQFDNESVLVDDFVVVLSQLAMNFHTIETRISPIHLISSMLYHTSESFVIIRVIRVYARTTAIR